MRSLSDSNVGRGSEVHGVMYTAMAYFQWATINCTPLEKPYLRSKVPQDSLFPHLNTLIQYKFSAISFSYT